MGYRVVLDADGANMVRAAAGRTAVAMHSVIYLDLPHLFLTRQALVKAAHAVVIRARARSVDGMAPVVAVELRRRSGDVAVHQRWNATAETVCALADGACEPEAVELRKRLEMAVFAGVPVMHELRPVVVIRYARMEWCVGLDSYLALEACIAYHRPPRNVADAFLPAWEGAPVVRERAAILDVDVRDDAPAWLAPIVRDRPHVPFSKLRNAIHALYAPPNLDWRIA